MFNANTWTDLDNFTNSFGPLVVAGQPRQAALLRPTAISIHDNSNMFRGLSHQLKSTLNHHDFGLFGLQCGIYQFDLRIGQGLHLCFPKFLVIF